MLFRQRTFFVLERYEVCVKHGNACTEILHGVALQGRHHQDHKLRSSTMTPYRRSSSRKASGSMTHQD